MELDTESKINLIIQKISEIKGPRVNHSKLINNGLNDQNKCYEEEFGQVTSDQIESQFKENYKSLVDFILGLDEKENGEIYRSLSCIYGAFLGDSTGLYCQSMLSSKMNWKKDNDGKGVFEGKPKFGEAPGEITKASEMAMSLAYAIMDMTTKNEIDTCYAYFYYGFWKDTIDPNKLDIGENIKQALSHFNIENYDIEKTDWNTYQELINNKDLDNRLLMKISPFIIWSYFRNHELVQEAFTTDNKGKYPFSKLYQLYKIVKTNAEKDNICTHSNKELFSVSATFTLFGLASVYGLEGKEIIKAVQDLFLSDEFQKEGNEFDKKVATIFQQKLVRFTPNDFNAWNYFTLEPDNVLKNMISYKHAFSMTIYYLLNWEKYLNQEDVFNSIMREICEMGGDTAANASIVGSIIGPFLGYKNFGKNFKTMIELISPRKKEYYSPALMVWFIDYVLKTNDDSEDIKDDNNFLKMILTMIFTKIDTKHLFNLKQLNNKID